MEAAFCPLALATNRYLLPGYRALVRVGSLEIRGRAEPDSEIPHCAIKLRHRESEFTDTFDRWPAMAEPFTAEIDIPEQFLRTRHSPPTSLENAIASTNAESHAV
jgi:hypothetical protein